MYTTFPGTFTHDGRKVCIKEVGWKTESTADPAIIAEWTRLYAHKIKFWGIPTGALNGLLVLDVDIKDNGHETIKNYHVPLTQTQRTKSGGIHHIYRYPTDGHTYGNRTKFDVGLDIRGEGGYIAWYNTADSTPICEAPEWLLQQSLKAERIIEHDSTAVKISPDVVKQIVQEACELVRSAPEGESNNVLNIESYRLGQLVTSNSLNKQEAFNALYTAAIERGKPSYESTATINSGLDGGSQHPLTCPFGDVAPVLTIPEQEETVTQRWTPPFFTKYDLTNISKLKKPQLFKDWSTEDIHITTADGGTGKTTLKLCEAISLALGESFLGFECREPGRTLFITGEDTREKLGAMLGVILKQMKILDDPIKVSTILNAIVVKKEPDMCIISKSKQGFITPNLEAFDKVMEAVEDIRPKFIIFDPISHFWGGEALLNDMSKAVAKFMAMLVEKSNACVEIINHMGKVSSKDKDMSQFAGRGGTALPSHARVSRVLRPVFDDEFEEMVGRPLEGEQSAMMCNVNKFSDGSPLYNKPFLIVREGFLFSRITLVEKKIKEEQTKMSDNERVFTFIHNERKEQRYPTKNVIISQFMQGSDRVSKDRIVRSLESLQYLGHMGEKIKLIENPDIEMRERAYIITDMEGVER